MLHPSFDLLFAFAFHACLLTLSVLRATFRASFSPLDSFIRGMLISFISKGWSERSFD
jgi:hypothetical protein